MTAVKLEDARRVISAAEKKAKREAEDREYFVRFSVPGYAFGINALLYAMTH